MRACWADLDVRLSRMGDVMRLLTDDEYSELSEAERYEYNEVCSANSEFVTLEQENYDGLSGTNLGRVWNGEIFFPA